MEGKGSSYLTSNSSHAEDSTVNMDCVASLPGHFLMSIIFTSLF